MNRRSSRYAIQLGTLISALMCVIASYGQNVTTTKGMLPSTVVPGDPPNDRTGVGPFKSGFAAVVSGKDSYYINTKGEKIRLIGNAVLGESYRVEEYEREKHDADGSLLPGQKVVFEKDGKRGVLSPTGEMIVPAAYDHIETEYRQFWKLYQGNKKTFYLPDGSTLPFFDEIGYLDGEYFDVSQDGAWHLYSKSKGKIVTKNAYEGFDFCGGCSTGAPYVYAKKAGKWGIISWEEEILVPFAFEHEHRSMRNDNWVTSFSQNGKNVIVHIPTQQVFDASSSGTAIVSGMLVTSENGLFGAYNRDGKPVVPFEYENLAAPNANSYNGYYGNYLIARKDHKTGVIHTDGNIVLPIDYSEVTVYDDFFVAKTDAYTSLLRAGDMNPLLKMEHIEIDHINNAYYSSGSAGLSIFKVKQKAYYGLYFVDNKRFYDPTFYNVSLRRSELVEGGEIIEAEKQGLKTLFDIHGEKVVPFDVQDYQAFEVNDKLLLAFKIKGYWGVYDVEQHREIVPPRYDQYFKLLDSARQVVIQAFADGFSEIDLYDMQGNKLNDTPLNKIDPIDNRYYLLEKDKPNGQRYALFDVEHRVSEDLPFPYVAALRGTEKLLMISHNGIDGRLYDFKNKQELERWYNVYVFPVYVDDPEDSEHWTFYGFEKGYAKVQSKAGVGYINELGEVVVPPKYTQARFVGEDHVLVSDGDYTNVSAISYFIDKKGKVVFPAAYFVDEMLYHNIDQFYIDGKVILMRNDNESDLYFGMGELKTGEMLIPAEYYELSMSDLDATYILLTVRITENGSRNGEKKFKYGLANTDGRILFEPKFDAIYRPRLYAYGSSKKQEPCFPLLVMQEGKWRYLHEDGSYLPIEGDYVYE